MSKVQVRTRPTRACKNVLYPLYWFLFLINNNLIEIIVAHTNMKIEIKSKKYKGVKAIQRSTDAREIRAHFGILLLTIAMKDNQLPSKEVFDVIYCGNRYEYRSNMPCEKFYFLIN